MLKKISTAAKNMAQRAMMRGNVGASEAITSMGDMAAKNILRNQPQNVITQKPTGSTGVHGVIVQEGERNVKKDLQTGGHVQTSNQSQSNKKLGSSIIDALQ